MPSADPWIRMSMRIRSGRDFDTSVSASSRDVAIALTLNPASSRQRPMSVATIPSSSTISIRPRVSPLGILVGRGREAYQELCSAVANDFRRCVKLPHQTADQFQAKTAGPPKVHIFGDPDTVVLDD